MLMISSHPEVESVSAGQEYKKIFLHKAQCFPAVEG